MTAATGKRNATRGGTHSHTEHAERTAPRGLDCRLLAVDPIECGLHIFSRRRARARAPSPTYAHVGPRARRRRRRRRACVSAWLYACVRRIDVRARVCGAYAVVGVRTPLRHYPRATGRARTHTLATIHPRAKQVTDGGGGGGTTFYYTRSDGEMCIGCADGGGGRYRPKVAAVAVAAAVRLRHAHALREEIGRFLR